MENAIFHGVLNGFKEMSDDRFGLGVFPEAKREKLGNEILVRLPDRII